MRSIRSMVASAALVAATLAAQQHAQADTIIKDPNPPKYPVEIEPKLNVAALFYKSYGGEGFGPGVRFSIPLMSPGFIKTINNSVAIGFGLDLMRYNGGYYGYYGYYNYCNNNRNRCPGWTGAYDASFWAIHVPVVMQWNFWITDKWSVFGEPGLTIRHAFYPDVGYCGAGYDPIYGSCYPDRTNIYFTFFAGGRYHFSERVALTMRLGHPIDFSIGLSIFL
jgi:hypothetical protein